MSVIILISFIFCHLEIMNRMLVAADTLVHYNLCGPEMEVPLEAFGEASAITIHLLPNHLQRSQCKLKVTAPTTHVIYMQWSDTSEQIHRTFIENRSSNSPCPLNVFLPENKRTAVWKGDPCSLKDLPEVDLLTPQVRLMWTPPRWGNHTRGRTLILTAVGQGKVCKNTGQHTCMRIGWDPILCVAEHLICDGTINCPKGSSTSDEGDELCLNPNLPRQTSWEKLAVELIKKFKPANGLLMPKKWPHDKKSDEMSTSEVPETNWKIPAGTTPKPPKMATTTDSVSAALSHYGPWGYLMLGMLICGTVLMFCGLWECCFRRPKPTDDTMSPRQQPTTVLIVNNPNNESTSVQQPPNYDDLDQPPSYAVLFPNNKLPEFGGRTEMTVNIRNARDNSGFSTDEIETNGECSRTESASANTESRNVRNSNNSASNEAQENDSRV